MWIRKQKLIPVSGIICHPLFLISLYLLPGNHLYLSQCASVSLTWTYRTPINSITDLLIYESWRQAPTSQPRRKLCWVIRPKHPVPCSLVCLQQVLNTLSISLYYRLDPTFIGLEFIFNRVKTSIGYIENLQPSVGSLHKCRNYKSSTSHFFLQRAGSLRVHQSKHENLIWVGWILAHGLQGQQMWLQC